MNNLQRPIISNLNANINAQQQQQNSTCIVILPQTSRGNYILLRDSNGNCSLPKITLAPNNSEIDLHTEIENHLLSRCGHGYQLLKMDPKFQLNQVISPVVDFDFSHGNLNVTHYVYHAQSLDQTVSINDLDASNLKNSNSKTLHFMTIVDMEKELNDPQIIRDVVTRYTLSFLVSQKIKESFDVKLGTTRFMFATAGVLVSVVVGFLVGQF